MLPRTALHSAILALLNLASIWVGFVAFQLLGAENQLAVQSPIAFTLTVGLFLGWMRLVSSRGWSRLRVRGWGDAGWIFGLALVWAAVVFVPLHLLTQGYLTAFGNVLAVWAFQVAANTVAVGCAVTLGRRERKEVVARGEGPEMPRAI